MIDTEAPVSNGASSRGRGGFRGNRGGFKAKGKRSGFRRGRGRHSRGDRGKNFKTNFKEVLDPMGLFLEFSDRVNVANVSVLLDNLGDVNSIKMGNYIKVEFQSEEEAKEAKDKLDQINCELGTIKAEYAFIKEKRPREDAEQRSTKKAKIEKDDEEKGEEEGKKEDEKGDGQEEKALEGEDEENVKGDSEKEKDEKVDDKDDGEDKDEEDDGKDDSVEEGDKDEENE